MTLNLLQPTDQCLVAELPAFIRETRAAIVGISGSDISIPGIFNVIDYGAKGDGVTDDGGAIAAAVIDLHSAGGGTLYFPYGRYKIFQVGTTYVNVAQFIGLSGINIISDGAILEVDQSKIFTIWTNIFDFIGCHNIVVDGFKVTGRVINALNPTQGPVFVELHNIYPTYFGCRNIRVTNIDIQGGCKTFVDSVTTDPAYTDAYDTKNIYIGNIYLKDIPYGTNLRTAGSNVVIENYECNKVGRAYFPYGVRNHKVQIVTTNHQYIPACLLAGGGAYGFGCENIELDITDLNSVQEGTNFAYSWVYLDCHGPATIFRNIKIKVNVVSAYTSTEAESVAFYTAYPGTGHIIENVEISGRIKGHAPIRVRGNFTSADYFDNIALRNLKMSGGTANELDLTALVNNFVAENVVSDANLGLTNIPTAAKISLINCKTLDLNTEYIVGPIPQMVDVASPTSLFTCSGSLTISFSGATVVYRTKQIGKLLYVEMRLDAGTLGGTTDSWIYLALPGSLKFKSVGGCAGFAYDPTTHFLPLVVGHEASGTVFKFLRGDGAKWTTGTALNITFAGAFEVE